MSPEYEIKSTLLSPGEIEEQVRSGIWRYRQGYRADRLALMVANQPEKLINHPDISDEIHYWKHYQYYRMAKQWRWIASCRHPESDNNLQHIIDTGETRNE